MVPYGMKCWRRIKFGGLVDARENRQNKLRQNKFRRCVYARTCLIMVRQIKIRQSYEKSKNSEYAKYNSRQFFLHYGVTVIWYSGDLVSRAPAQYYSPRWNGVTRYDTTSRDECLLRRSHTHKSVAASRVCLFEFLLRSRPRLVPLKVGSSQSVRYNRWKMKWLLLIWLVRCICTCSTTFINKWGIVKYSS